MRRLLMATVAIMALPGAGLARCVCVECLTGAAGMYRATAEHMMPGFSPGDCVIARRADPVRAGDVAILESALWDRPMIFRVIATGGQRVGMAGGVPVIDGGAARRTGAGSLPAAVLGMDRLCPGGGCEVPLWRETLPSGVAYDVADSPGTGPRDAMPERLLPPNAIFVLGDNRDNVMDLRFLDLMGATGDLTRDQIVGRVAP